MRVLYLCHSHADTTIGGVAEFLHYLPLALQREAVDVVIYTQSETPTNKLSAPIRLANGVLHYSGPFLKPRFYVSDKELMPLIELCQTEKIDLIHAQGTYRAGYVAMQIKKRTGIPYVVTSHSDISPVNSKRLRRFNVKNRCQRILKNADYVTHLTPFMAEHSHAIYDTRDKSMLIHNGIDLAAWNNSHKQQEQNYLLAIGRLEPEKGFSILIDAYAALQNQGMQTSLVIAGTGSEELALQQRAQQLHLNVITEFKDDNIPSASIVFTGYVRGEYKMQLFNQAKIILFSTQPQGWEEAFGIVQLEAMAAGKAIIASDIATTRYIQTLGQQSQLVQADNVSAWANAISALLQNNDARQEMGNKNQQAVQQFDWQPIAQQYKQVYGRVLK